MSRTKKIQKPPHPHPWPRVYHASFFPRLLVYYALDSPSPNLSRENVTFQSPLPECTERVPVLRESSPGSGSLSAPSISPSASQLLSYRTSSWPPALCPQSRGSHPARRVTREVRIRLPRGILGVCTLSVQTQQTRERPRASSKEGGRWEGEPPHVAN